MEFVGGIAASTRPQLDGDLTGCLGTVSRAASSKAEVPSVIRFTTRTRSSHERQPYANGVSARFPLAVVAGVQPFRRSRHTRLVGWWTCPPITRMSRTNEDCPTIPSWAVPRRIASYWQPCFQWTDT